MIFPESICKKTRYDLHKIEAGVDEKWYGAAKSAVSVIKYLE